MANELKEKKIVSLVKSLKQEDGSIKRILVDYDFTPLKLLLEDDGMDLLINSLELLHNDIVRSLLANSKTKKPEIFEDPEMLENYLFHLRELANSFREIEKSAYTLNDWPEVPAPDMN